MKGYTITLDDGFICKVCAENEPTIFETYSVNCDSHKITFDMPVRGIEEDEDMMCE